MSYTLALTKGINIEKAFVYNFDGKTVKSIPLGLCNYSSLTWSKDNKQLYFTTGSEMEAMSYMLIGVTVSLFIACHL